MERVELVVKPRTTTGTRAARRLRKEGLVPGVLYGSGKAASPIAIDVHALRAALTTEAGRHAIIDVTVEGKKRTHKAILKEYQLDPVRHMVRHVDLQEVRLDEPIESTVAIVMEGVPAGVKMGGILDIVTHEVTVRGLPGAIPEHLVLNVEGLDIGDAAHVGDVTTPEGITIVDDVSEIVCTVLPPRVAGAGEEVTPTAAQPELVGGEAAGEGTEA